MAKTYFFGARPDPRYAAPITPRPYAQNITCRINVDLDLLAFSAFSKALADMSARAAALGAATRMYQDSFALFEQDVAAAAKYPPAPVSDATPAWLAGIAAEL